MIEKLQQLGYKLNLISYNELNCYSVVELLYLIINRVNDVIDVLNGVTSIGIEHIVVDELNRWLDDGTLAKVINEEVFTELSSAIDALKILDVALLGAKGDGISNDTQYFETGMQALKLIGGGTLHVPKGTYSVGYFLLESNSHLQLDNEAVLKAQLPVIASNFLAEETHIGGYNGRSNIKISGGTIDANGYHVSAGTPIQFGHCHDIVIENVRFINTVDDHALELVGVNRAVIDNCRFEGYVNKTGITKAYKEAIQIDFCASGHGGGGLADMTPSKNVTVRKCYFGGLDSYYGVFPSAVGSHGETVFLENPMDNIVVENCMIDGCRNGGITPYGWSNSRISGNVIKDSEGFGIMLKYCDNVIINDNIINGANDGIGLYTTDFINVHDNHVMKTKKHGIHATEASSNIYIKDNLFVDQNLIYNDLDVSERDREATYAGIAVTSDSNTHYSTDIIITNNTVSSHNNEVAYGIDVRNKAKNVVVEGNHLLAQFKKKAYQNRQAETLFKDNRVTLFSGEAYLTETDVPFTTGYLLSDFDEYEITVEANGIECRTFLATEKYPKIRCFNLTDSVTTFAVNLYEMNINMYDNRLVITTNTSQYIDTTNATNTKQDASNGTGMKILKVVGIKYNWQIRR